MLATTSARTDDAHLAPTGAQHDHHRQGLPLQGPGGRPEPGRADPAAPSRTQRDPTPRRRPPAPCAPEDRVRLRHPQGPAQTRAPQRTHPHRSHRTHRPTHPGPDNHHLTQRQHRQPPPTPPDPLRPPTKPPEINHLGLRPRGRTGPRRRGAAPLRPARRAHHRPCRPPWEPPRHIGDKGYIGPGTITQRRKPVNLPPPGLLDVFRTVLVCASGCLR